MVRGLPVPPGVPLQALPRPPALPRLRGGGRGGLGELTPLRLGALGDPRRLRRGPLGGLRRLALVLLFLLAALPSGGSPSGRVVRAVEGDRLELSSGPAIPWSRVHRVLLHAGGARVPVPRQVVSPGDAVLSWDGRTLVVEAHLVRGEFLDARHGELLLGRVNLALPAGAEVRCNGRPVELARLPRARAALARRDGFGRAWRLEVVDPGLKAGVGEVGSVRAGLKPGAEAPLRPLRAGEPLHLELRAPPGGTASFDLAGVAWGLPAREVRPGLYRARFVVPAGLDAPRTWVLGRYRRGGEEGVRVGPEVSLAPTPPQVLSQGPTGAATPEAPVFATYGSPGAALDAGRVRLWLDGTDVTRQALRRVDLAWFQPPGLLAPGPHRVRLEVFDTAGNRTGHSWTFQVGEGPGR